VQYFDGVTTFEEIMFHTSLSRRELDRIALVYRDDVSEHTGVALTADHAYHPAIGWSCIVRCKGWSRSRYYEAEAVL
jgi:hypothetical protein